MQSLDKKLAKLDVKSFQTSTDKNERDRQDEKEERMHDKETK